VAYTLHLDSAMLMTGGKIGARAHFSRVSQALCTCRTTGRGRLRGPLPVIEESYGVSGGWSGRRSEGVMFVE
jgi:hypothetical protein